MANRISRSTAVAAALVIGGSVIQPVSAEGYYRTSPPRERAQAQGQSERAGIPAVAQNSMAQEIMNAHNRYRAEVGVPSLTWSNTLASHAQQWANHLASMGGKLQHSSNAGRPNEGENLWKGTSLRFSFTQMVGSWGNEKQHFVAGRFPKVSNTGNWVDVGHYTQVIWRGTTQVGCGGVDAGGNYIFVCRYSAPGNYTGQPVF